MPQDSASRDLEKVIIRLPDGMREALKAKAAANGRSANAEIIARLAASLSETDIAQIVKNAVREALDEHARGEK